MIPAIALSLTFAFLSFAARRQVNTKRALSLSAGCFLFCLVVLSTGQ